MHSGSNNSNAKWKQTDTGGVNVRDNDIDTLSEAIDLKILIEKELLALHKSLKRELEALIIITATTTTTTTTQHSSTKQNLKTKSERSVCNEYEQSLNSIEHIRNEINTFENNHQKYSLLINRKLDIQISKLKNTKNFQPTQKYSQNQQTKQTKQTKQTPQPHLHSNSRNNNAYAQYSGSESASVSESKSKSDSGHNNNSVGPTKYYDRDRDRCTPNTNKNAGASSSDRRRRPRKRSDPPAFADANTIQAPSQSQSRSLPFFHASAEQSTHVDEHKHAEHISSHHRHESVVVNNRYSTEGRTSIHNNNNIESIVINNNNNGMNRDYYRRQYDDHNNNNIGIRDEIRHRRCQENNSHNHQHIPVSDHHHNSTHADADSKTNPGATELQKSSPKQRQRQPYQHNAADSSAVLVSTLSESEMLLLQNISLLLMQSWPMPMRVDVVSELYPKPPRQQQKNNGNLLLLLIERCEWLTIIDADNVNNANMNTNHSHQAWDHNDQQQQQQQRRLFVSLDSFLFQAYLSNSSQESVRKELIQRKFIHFLLNVHPNGIYASQLSVFFHLQLGWDLRMNSNDAEYIHEVSAIVVWPEMQSRRSKHMHEEEQEQEQEQMPGQAQMSGQEQQKSKQKTKKRERILRLNMNVLNRFNIRPPLTQSRVSRARTVPGISDDNRPQCLRRILGFDDMLVCTIAECAFGGLCDEELTVRFEQNFGIRIEIENPFIRRIIVDICDPQAFSMQSYFLKSKMKSKCHELIVWFQRLFGGTLSRETQKQQDLLQRRRQQPPRQLRTNQPQQHVLQSGLQPNTKRSVSAKTLRFCGFAFEDRIEDFIAYLRDECGVEVESFQATIVFGTPQRQNSGWFAVTFKSIHYAESLLSMECLEFKCNRIRVQKYYGGNNMWAMR